MQKILAMAGGVVAVVVTRGTGEIFEARYDLSSPANEGEMVFSLARGFGRTAEEAVSDYAREAFRRLGA